MFNILLFTFLLSISPLGEARVGIPYAILNDVPFAWAFIVGLVGNLLIFPLLMLLIDTFNARLWPNRHYKKGVVRLSRIAKKRTGDSIEKYGFWGLMIFVMIPLPGTGAYVGTIAAALFKINRQKAFWAVSLGVICSCIIMAIASHFGNMGLESF
jgi:uncharacterized membrane protein